MITKARSGIMVWGLPLWIGCTAGLPTTFDTGTTPYVGTDINDTIESECAADGVEPVFKATSTVHGRIDVEHTGYLLPNCGVYHVFVDRPDVFRLVLDYGRIEDTAEECSDDCMWTFTYMIPVEDGDWTLELLVTHETAQVSVR